MNKMVNVRIFDDQYGLKIYDELNSLLPKLNYPVKDNVVSPIVFLDKIKDGDIILLDNYFPGETREEPLGEDFLQIYLDKGLSCKIICISDYGKVLLDKYVSWDLVNQKGDIIGWMPTKDAKEISNLLNFATK